MGNERTEGDRIIPGGGATYESRKVVDLTNYSPQCLLFELPPFDLSTNPSPVEYLPFDLPHTLESANYAAAEVHPETKANLRR